MCDYTICSAYMQFVLFCTMYSIQIYTRIVRPFAVFNVNHLPYSMNQTLRSSENLFARAALERINRPEHDKDLSLSLSASHIIRILNCVQCGNVSRCPAHSPVTMRTRIFQHLLPADQLTFAMCSMASRKSDVYRKRIVSIRRCSHETGQE